MSRESVLGKVYRRVEMKGAAKSTPSFHCTADEKNSNGFHMRGEGLRENRDSRRAAATVSLQCFFLVGSMVPTWNMVQWVGLWATCELCLLIQSPGRIGRASQRGKREEIIICDTFKKKAHVYTCDDDNCSSQSAGAALTRKGHRKGNKGLHHQDGERCIRHASGLVVPEIQRLPGQGTQQEVPAQQV